MLPLPLRACYEGGRRQWISKKYEQPRDSTIHLLTLLFFAVDDHTLKEDDLKMMGTIKQELSFFSVLPSLSAVTGFGTGRTQRVLRPKIRTEVFCLFVCFCCAVHQGKRNLCKYMLWNLNCDFGEPIHLNMFSCLHLHPIITFKDLLLHKTNSNGKNSR